MYDESYFPYAPQASLFVSTAIPPGMILWTEMPVVTNYSAHIESWKGIALGKVDKLRVC